MAEEKQTRKALTTRESAVQNIRRARHIFITYSHSDLRQAKNIQRRIVKLRRELDPETVFVDQMNLLPGEDISPAVIDSKLRGSDLMIVLCGPDTPQRTEVQRELELGAKLRKQGVLTILPIILKTGVRLPSLIDYSIQAIQLTTLFPEILWVRFSVTALTLAALLVATIFAWRSNNDRLLAQRVNYAALVQRLIEQVDQELSPDNRNRNAGRALLLARQAYDLLGRADAGHRSEVELALHKALAPFPPLRLFYRDSDAGQIVDIRFSNDGRQLAAVFEQRLLLFRETESTQPITFEAKERFKAARFSPDGTIVVATSHIGELCFWQTSASNQQRGASACQILPGEPDIQAFEFHPATGHLIVIVTTAKNSSLQHWDPTTKGLISAEALPIVPSALAIASDGQLLLTTTSTMTQFRSGWRALVNKERVDSLAVRPDGKRWAGLTPTGSIVFWRPGSPQSIPIDRAAAKAFAYDPRGEFLVTARAGSIEFHDVDFVFESMASRALPCSDDNTALTLSTQRRLAIACDNTIFLWDLSSIKNLHDSPGKRTIDLDATLLVFHPSDPLRVAVAKRDGAVEVINVQTGDRRTIDRSACGNSLASQLVSMGAAALDREVVSIKWSTSDQLTVAQKNGEVWTADTNSAKASCDPMFLGGRTCIFASSADGTWQAAIAEIAGRSLLSVWSSKASDGHQALDSGLGPVVCTGAVAFHPKDPVLIGGANNELKRWTRASNGKWTSEGIEHFDAPLTAVAYSSKGDWLAAAGGNGLRNGYLWLWCTTTPKAQARIYTFPEAAIESIAFGPQGAVAAALSDGTVVRWMLDRLDENPMRLGGTSGLLDDWNPSKRLEKAANLARILGPVMVTPSDVDAMAAPKTATYLTPAYNADGSLFGAVSRARIEILDTDARGLAEQVCKLAPANLSRLDWVRFVGASDPYELTCPNRPVHPSLLADADREAALGRDQQALLLYREIRRLEGAAGRLDPDRRLSAWKERRQITNNIKPDREKLVTALEAWSRLAASNDQSVPALSFEETLRLCRWSILLTGDGKHALPVCERAVDLLPDMMAIDSRGMARALTSDWSGALSDLGKSADYLNDSRWRKEHAAWIETLQARRNPITADVRQRIAADELSK
jgi:WD40 repeat protein